MSLPVNYVLDKGKVFYFKQNVISFKIQVSLSHHFLASAFKNLCNGSC